MQPNDPPSSDPTVSTSSEITGTGSRPRGRMRGWFLPTIAMAVGLVGGVAAWAIGETPAVIVPAVEKEVPFMGMGPSVPSLSPESELAAQQETAARAFGLLGGLTGLLLGLAGGLTSGSRRRALVAGGVGLIVGVLVSAGITWVAVPGFEGWRLASPGDLVPCLLLHGVCWLPIGAVGGLALGLGLGGRDRLLSGLVGGILGAFLATLVYEFLGAALFPMAGTGEPISTTPMSRLLGRLLVPVLTGLGAALAGVLPATSGPRPRPDMRPQP